MLYRMRIYQAVEENVEIFNRFFNEHLLPIQKKYGARLVGRWQTEDCRIVAVWEYDNHESYQQIQEKVRADPDSQAAQKYRKTLPSLINNQEEVFMHNTEFARSAI